MPPEKIRRVELILLYRDIALATEFCQAVAVPAHPLFRLLVSQNNRPEDERTPHRRRLTYQR